MKKYFKKVIACVMALAIMAVSVGTLPALQAKAATKGVTIFFQNTDNWKDVYCYTWYGSGAVGTAWPGQKMTDAGNGWMKATYTGDKPLNVIFNNNGKPKIVQTADQTPKDLPLTQEAYWFTLASTTSQNAGGEGGGTNVIVNTAAKSGWPTVAAAVTSSSASTVTTTKDATPKTGDNNTVAVIGTVGFISLAAVCLLLNKRKIKA
jgi:hypothetical protein